MCEWNFVTNSIKGIVENKCFEISDVFDIDCDEVRKIVFNIEKNDNESQRIDSQRFEEQSFKNHKIKPQIKPQIKLQEPIKPILKKRVTILPP